MQDIFYRVEKDKSVVMYSDIHYLIKKIDDSGLHNIYIKNKNKDEKGESELILIDILNESQFSIVSFKKMLK